MPLIKKTSKLKPLGAKSEPKETTNTGGIKPLGKLNKGGLKKLKSDEPKEEVKEEKQEEVKEEPKKPLNKLNKVGKVGIKKKVAPKTIELEDEEENKNELTEEQLIAKQEDEAAEAMLGASEEEMKEYQESLEEKTEPKEEVKEEKKEEPKTKAKTTRSKTKKKDTETKVTKSLEVDESKRVSIEEMDEIMRPIVAPTTEVWEQEKKDVLDALNNIKVEQDMEMTQVKSCLADLDDLNFEVLPKLHDAETMYDGTKQNYETVKAVAIANGSGGNAESRKAEGILACKNFTTPTGAVVDLQQYMLLIEERYKFYQKIADGVNFKKYSLVNYNNALKVESKNS